MPVKPTEKIWHNGKFIPWKDATLHVMSHVVNYGSSVFEGIRCYAQPKGGGAIFRATEHAQRLLDSAKIYRIDVDYTREELVAAMLELVRLNRTVPCYIRPIVLRGYGEVGVNPLNSPVDVYIANYEWGKYLGSADEGADVCVSSWNRLAPNTMPTMSKSGANYMNSQLIKMEAIKAGYVEGIALDSEGYLSEGSGENLFLVKNGTLLTPPLVSSVLPGITRDSVMALARRLSIPVEEARMPRELLYIADEVFLTGTAAEITPVRSVDKITIGSGVRGPVTGALQRAFFDVVECRVPDEFGWLTPLRDVRAAETVATRRSTAG